MGCQIGRRGTKCAAIWRHRTPIVRIHVPDDASHSTWEKVSFPREKRACGAGYLWHPGKRVARAALHRGRGIGFRSSGAHQPRRHYGDIDGEGSLRTSDSADIDTLGWTRGCLIAALACCRPTRATPGITWGTWR